MPKVGDTSLLVYRLSKSYGVPWHGIALLDWMVRPPAPHWWLRILDKSSKQLGVSNQQHEPAVFFKQSISLDE